MRCPTIQIGSETGHAIVIAVESGGQNPELYLVLGHPPWLQRNGFLLRQNNGEFIARRSSNQGAAGYQPALLESEASAGYGLPLTPQVGSNLALVRVTISLARKQGGGRFIAGAPKLSSEHRQREGAHQ